MAEEQEQPYEICLTWPDGGRQIVSLSPETTFEDVRERARQHLGCSAVVLMTLNDESSPRPRPLTSSSSDKARSILSHMTQVYCTVAPKDNNNPKKRPRSEQEDEWACSACTFKNPLHLTSCEMCETAKGSDASENSSTIDLTGDEATVRSLHQQENESAVDVFAPRPGYLQATEALDPTTIESDYYWIRTDGPYRHESVLGKWLVFASEKNINQVWQKIWPAVSSGKLHAESCKVATMFGNRMSGKGSGYVICVYTSEERMDEVAFKLIQIVKQDVRYKTDEDTLAGRYASNSCNISKKALYWNNGNPTFVKPPPKPKMKSIDSLSMALEAAERRPQPQLNHSFEIV